MGPDHDPARPDIVLFNGGLFESPLLHTASLAAMQSIAGLMRYSEKLLRGYYFNKQILEGGATGAASPTA